MEGTQQSGIAFELHIANLAQDGQILQLARDVAQEVLEKDELLEQPRNYTLRKELNRSYGKKVNWGQIS
jgi:ATP-dependent DNA helicase RecG